MRIEKDCWLLTRPISHRGLWGNGVIENSLTAYNNAVKENYPIEIDLYLSTDGVLYSFHDSNLKRMTGVDGLIYEKSSAEINSLFLLKENGEKSETEKIPSFDEVLKLVDGKVPLLIEIKNQPNKLVVDKVIERLKAYNGQFALQSFNPLYINRIKKIAPSFIRGILATKDKDELKDEKFINRFVIKNMALNFLIKPDFISFNKYGFPLKTKKPKLAWTVTNETEYKNLKKYVNNIIFEKFIPKSVDKK